MKDDQPQRCRVHRLRFATANVETMEYNGDSDCGSIKANELLRQCQLEHIHICAIQESRARLSRIVTNEPFTRFVAKGCNGQAGVELWLNGEELAKIFHCDFQPEKDVCVCGIHRNASLQRDAKWVHQHWRLSFSMRLKEAAPCKNKNIGGGTSNLSWRKETNELIFSCLGMAIVVLVHVLVMKSGILLPIWRMKEVSFSVKFVGNKSS